MRACVRILSSRVGGYLVGGGGQTAKGAHAILRHVFCQQGVVVPAREQPKRQKARSGRRRVWLIYADADLAACEALARHLRPWTRAGRLEVDYRVQHPGADPAELVRRLPASDTDVVWLITVDSLAEGLHESEIEAARGRSIIPVVVRAALWEVDPRLHAYRAAAVVPSVKYTPETASDFWQEVAVRCWGVAPRAAWKWAVVAAAVVLALAALSLLVSRHRRIAPPKSADVVVAIPLGAPDQVVSAHARLCTAFLADSALQQSPPRCLVLTPSWATPVIGGISRVDLDALPAEERPQLLVLVSEAADNSDVASIEVVLGRAVPLGELVRGIHPHVPFATDSVSRLEKVLVEVAALVAPDIKADRESVPVPAPGESGVAVTVLAALARDLRGQPPDEEELRAMQEAEAQCASGDAGAGCGDAATRAVCCAGRALRALRDPTEPAGSAQECCLDLPPALRPLVIALLNSFCYNMVSHYRSSPSNVGPNEAVLVYRRLASFRSQMNLDIAFIGPAACAEALRERLSPEEPTDAALVLLASIPPDEVARIASDPTASPGDQLVSTAIAAGSLAQRGFLAGARRDWRAAREDYRAAATLAPAQPRYMIDWAEAALWQGADDEVLERLPARLTHEELFPVPRRIHAAFLRWLAACRAGREAQETWAVLEQSHAALQRDASVVRAIDDASGSLGDLVCHNQSLPERACALYRDLITPKSGAQRSALGDAPLCQHEQTIPRDTR